VEIRLRGNRAQHRHARNHGQFEEMRFGFHGIAFVFCVGVPSLRPGMFAGFARWMAAALPRNSPDAFCLSLD
jgi:hypothetical protein